MAEVCKTDLKRITQYLDALAEIYGSLGGQRNKARKYYVDYMSKKLKRKLQKFHDDEKTINAKTHLFPP